MREREGLGIRLGIGARDRAKGARDKARAWA